MNTLILFSLCILAAIAILTTAINTVCVPIIFKNRFTRTLYLISSAIFVPIHEMSHALACLIFRHKITKMVLFSPNLTTGQLGYVAHSWDRNSLYQCIGCLFISIAPIITAAFSVYLMNPNIDMIHINETKSFISLLVQLIDTLYIFIGNILLNTQNGNTGWTIGLFLLCYFCIPSLTDFKNSAKGSLIVAITLMPVISMLDMGDVWDLTIFKTLTFIVSAAALGTVFCLALTGLALIINIRMHTWK